MLIAEEFVGDMPEEYRESGRLLRRGLKRNSGHDKQIIVQMMNDCNLLAKTIEEYYEPLPNPRRLSMVHVSSAKQTFYKGNDFERRILQAVVERRSAVEEFFG